MTIDMPKISHAMALRTLFADSFGEEDAFIERFFSVSYSPSRARAVIDGEQVKAALYWFDCELHGKRVAYIFALSTAGSERGKGLATQLMKDTHEHLKSIGYSGAILVPAEDSLYGFYERLGYRDTAHIAEFSVTASDKTAEIKEVSSEEYLALREKFLPIGGVKESIELINLLAADAKLYTGKDFLLAARKCGDTLLGIELLGNTEKAPNILAALECSSGKFRTVGEDRKFAMLLPFEKKLSAPTYFGIALDV